MNRRITILALVVLPAIVSAAEKGPVENMFDQCQEVMKPGLCQVALDPKDYPVGGRTLISSIGRVSNASYLNFRNAGWGLEPDGKTYTMCAKIKTACSADLTETDPSTDNCKVARGLWKKTPVVQASMWERIYAWASAKLST